MDTHLKNNFGILNLKSAKKLLRSLDKQIVKDKLVIIKRRPSLIRSLKKTNDVSLMKKLRKTNNVLNKITQL